MHESSLISKYFPAQETLIIPVSPYLANVGVQLADLDGALAHLGAGGLEEGAVLRRHSSALDRDCKKKKVPLLN
jgi:hypothetical protein